VVAFLSTEASRRASAIAANALLHPARRAVQQTPPDNCQSAVFAGAGVMLKGWQCRTLGHARGTVIYLHGVADNRESASSIIRRYNAKGFDVIAYDSRAHGESDGSACTYGYLEKHDLLEIVDTAEYRPIVLIGTSLGAAVALQAAALDARIAGVVAAETFSSLRTVAIERAPWVLTDNMIARAFRLAEQSGRFELGAISPERAAAGIRAPVLLIHGAEDHATLPAHSQRVMAALRGPKRLILVEGAGHNESLRHESIWIEIDEWIEQLVSRTRD
jgi:pimeloyl-ACP methyl ester carboxylesterase